MGSIGLKLLFSEISADLVILSKSYWPRSFLLLSYKDFLIYPYFTWNVVLSPRSKLLLNAHLPLVHPSHVIHISTFTNAPLTRAGNTFFAIAVSGGVSLGRHTAGRTLPGGLQGRETPRCCISAQRGRRPPRDTITRRGALCPGTAFHSAAVRLTGK